MRWAMISETENKKPERERDMTEGLLRQRRNLLVVSIAVIFFYLADIQITEVNLLGTKILLRNEIAVHVSLWIFFFYFGYRYTIYYLEEPLERLLNDYRSVLDRLAESKLRRLALKQNNQNLDADILKQVVSDRKFSLMRSGNYKSLSWLTAETNGLHAGTIHSDDQHRDVHVSSIYWKPYFLFHRFWAVIILSAKDSRVSDYWLPFLVATVSLCVGIAGLANRFL